MEIVCIHKNIWIIKFKSGFLHVHMKACIARPIGIIWKITGCSRVSSFNDPSWLSFKSANIVTINQQM